MPEIITCTEKYLTWRKENAPINNDGVTQNRIGLRRFTEFLKTKNIVNIEDVTYESILDYQKHMAVQKTATGDLLQVGSQNNFMVYVKSLFRWLLKEGIVNSDPADKVEYLLNPRKLAHYLTNNFPGGKGGMYQQLINLMPPHETYIESHLGRGAVMRKKIPAKRNIGIEIDARVVKMWKTEDDYDFELIHGDSISFLSDYKFTGKEMVYSDPPYLRDTRKKEESIYKHEYTIKQHTELLETLLKLPCYVMLSGYPSELYKETLKDWHFKSFQAATASGVATECIWMNYPAPVELHDYTYYGDTFRKRDRINQKKKKWIKRLHDLSEKERDIVLNILTWVKLGKPEDYKLYEFETLGDDLRECSKRDKYRKNWVRRLDEMPILEQKTMLLAINKAGFNI